MDCFNLICERCEENVGYQYVEINKREQLLCDFCLQDYVETAADYAEYQMVDR